ncbi:hypothetical protein TNCV_323821 [Trichonephila clavipes]|nr:hypothetical protein TNCV_323821 [Trichonephila clavipes]
MNGECKAKLAAGTVEIEAGASLFTDPISDMGNGRRRAAPIPRMKGENSRNRMREMYLIKRTPRQNGEGGRAPKHDRSIEAERRRGREERRKAVGTAESSKSRQ